MYYENTGYMTEYRLEDDKISAAIEFVKLVMVMPVMDYLSSITRTDRSLRKRMHCILRRESVKQTLEVTVPVSYGACKLWNLEVTEPASYGTWKLRYLK